ncbi:MAG: hypothetical protein ACXWO3_07985 [Isosphaeraceae bacterium]
MLVLLAERADTRNYTGERLLECCARENDDDVTSEEVLEGTSSIKDSMARVIIEEERADRF